MKIYQVYVSGGEYNYHYTNLKESFLKQDKALDYIEKYKQGKKDIVIQMNKCNNCKVFNIEVEEYMNNKNIISDYCDNSKIDIPYCLSIDFLSCDNYCYDRDYIEEDIFIKEIDVIE